MTTQSSQSSRNTSFRASLSFLSLTFGAFRAWHQRRRDQRILDSLGPDQLKDIGYVRGSLGEYERNW